MFLRMWTKPTETLLYSYVSMKSIITIILKEKVHDTNVNFMKNKSNTFVFITRFIHAESVCVGKYCG